MKIFLDACAIIYWIEMAEPEYSGFVKKLYQIRKKHPKSIFAASHLSLLECRVKPLRDKNEELLNRYQQFFCSGDLDLIAINPKVIEIAAELRAFHKIRTPDALQAAAALSISDDKVFVTNDKIFKKIPKLNVLLIN